MKRLQLPQNKLARLAINVVFIVAWFPIASQIKWVLNGQAFLPFIYPWQVGCDPGGGGLPNEICGNLSLIYHIMTFLVPIFFATRYIWFEKSRHRIFYGLIDKLKSIKNYEPRIYTTTSNADEIKKYAELKDQGIITEEEFQAKKKQILGL